MNIIIISCASSLSLSLPLYHQYLMNIIVSYHVMCIIIITRIAIISSVSHEHYCQLSCHMHHHHQHYCHCHNVMCIIISLIAILSSVSCEHYHLSLSLIAITCISLVSHEHYHHVMCIVIITLIAIISLVAQ